MICPSWERIHRKAKAETFHRYDPAGGKSANGNAPPLLGQTFYKHRMQMHRMVTVYVVAVGRTWVNSWRQHKRYFQQGKMVIIDKNQNHNCTKRESSSYPMKFPVNRQQGLPIGYVRDRENAMSIPGSERGITTQVYSSNWTDVGKLVGMRYKRYFSKTEWQ